MGQIHADVELINGNDMANFRTRQIGEDEIRKIGVRALVDTGSWEMAINENIQEYLQLPVVDCTRVRMADDQVVVCDVVGPLEIRYQDRKAIGKAFVLPGNAEPLLGLIPMESMDVAIDPARQELVGIHAGGPLCRI